MKEIALIGLNIVGNQFTFMRDWQSGQ